MSSVDDRIVNMKFENKQFTAGVDKTKRDLTGLESTITKTATGKGMTTLGGAAEAVSGKFSAMKVVGVTALATIASKATSAGLSLLKSFTIQPIMDGFREYQTGLQSVQTIMSNTGRPVKEVNAALDQLNKYADKTIYNFGEMAKNVGTFTAAGVDLDTSVQSIKGIANLAAMSGSTSQQASTAMYQLSQAISAGKVGLQDWNSVVNAGMGGKVFQTALSRTAMNMGSLADNAVALEGPLKKLTVNGESFRTSISAAAGQESWLTGDVLVETLKQISGGYTIAELRAKGFSKTAAKEIDKLARDAFDAATQIKTLPQLVGVIRESIGSTFASAFRTIIGDFDQSKKLWGDVGYAIIGPHGFLTRIQDGFTDTLESWAKKGGRDKVIAGFKNMFSGLGAVVGAFRDAFTDIFPPATGQALVKMSGAFKRFTEYLVPSKETVADLRTIFGGFFAVLHIGFSIVKAIASAIGSFLGALFKSSGDARGGILSLVASVAEVIIAFDAWLTKGGKLSDFMSKLGSVLGAALAPIVGIVGLIVEAFATLASGGGIEEVMVIVDKIRDSFLGMVEGMLGGLARITSPFEALSGFFEGLKDKIDGIRGSFDNALAPVDDIGGRFSALDGVTAQLQKVSDAGDNIGGKLADGFDRVAESAGKVKDETKGMYDAVAGAGADAAATGTDKVAGGAERVASVFSWVGNVLKSIGRGIGDAFSWMVEQISKIPFPDDALEWATILNALISGALIKRLFFSKGLFKQLQESVKQMGNSVSDSFGQLTDTLKTMQGAIKSEIIKNIAIAVALLVASLIALSFIPQDKLAKGLGALAITMAMAGIMMKVMLRGMDDIKPKELAAKGTAMLAIGAAMVLMATSVAILTAAVAALAFIPFDKLKQGIGGVAVLMGIMVVSLKMLSGIGPSVLAAGGAMVFMATAIDIMVAAILVLGVIPFEVLKQGLAAVAIGIGIMTVSLLMLSGAGPAVLAAGAAMVMMALALDVLVVAVTALGLLPWDVVEQGLKAIAIGLGIMTLSLLLLSAAGPSVLAAGAAMIMIAGALNVLMTVILALGAAPWEVVKQGLMAMAIALGILLVAAALAMVVAPGLAALATTILAMGAAMLMAGAGMFLFGAGLALIAAAGVAAIAVIVLAIHAFIALLPTIAVQVAAAFVSFVQAIALAAPKLRKAFGIIFKEMIGTVRDAIPEIGKLLQELINTGIGILEESIPRWVEMGFTIIDEFLESAANHIPNIVDNAYALVTMFMDEIGSRVGELAQAGLDMVVDLLQGIEDAVEGSDRVRDAAWSLVRTFADEIREAMADLLGNINPMNYLPDVSLSDLKGLLPGGGGGDSKRTVTSGNQRGLPGRGDNGKSGPATLADQIAATAIEVAKAIDNSIRLLTNSVSGGLYNLQKAASDLRKKATFESVQAESMGASATSADENATAARDKANAMKQKAKDIENKKKREKALKAAKDADKKADRLRKQANAQQKAADAAAKKAAITQMKADYESQKAQDAVTYKDDAAGLGDAKSQQGQQLAEESNQMLASAQAKAAEIKRLEALAAKGGKNAQAYRKQAAQLRKEAAAETAQSMLLAAQAIEAQAAAVAAYAAARKEAALDVIARMADIRKQQEEEAAEREWDKKYQEADDATKKSMLETRAAANEAKAAAANVALQAAYAAADALAAQIAAGAAVSDEQLAAVQLAMEQAEQQAAIANQAADAAAADRETIRQLEQQIANANASGGTSTGGGQITPSRTALEDAALAVDRYTASVQQAEEYAGAAAGAPQFVQNNYSPEALSASQIYRQSKNLVSAAEVKMGAGPNP